METRAYNNIFQGVYETCLKEKLLTKLYLCWKILNDFNQVLAPLCKGFIYRVSFQASLGEETKKNHKHFSFAAFDIPVPVKIEIQVRGRSEIHTSNLTS